MEDKDINSTYLRCSICGYVSRRCPIEFHGLERLFHEDRHPGKRVEWIPTESPYMSIIN